MDKFGFIVHPIDIDQARLNIPKIKWLPKFVIKKALKYKKEFVLSKIKNVRSITGKVVEGYLIACPLLPDQILKLNESFVLNKIISAGRIAKKLGAKIVGLGGYTSVIGDKGETIAKNLKISVTSGNCYTTASVIEGVLKAAKIMNIDLRKAKVAIVGATGSIGNACTRILSNYMRKIIITARHRDRLEVLKNEISKASCIKIEIEENVHNAVKDAEVVIVTTSTPESLIDLNELKSGSIACDVSVPKNISGRERKRNDVLIFDGGLIHTPSKIEFNVDTGLPPGIIYACICETIILALEGRFENFSLGGYLSLDKIDEISMLAKKHGFFLEEIKM